MAKGLAVYSGTTIVHRLLDNGTVSFSGSVAVTGNLSPNGDGVRELGSPSTRWKDIFALQTTVGAIFEYGLSTPSISQLCDGTLLVWGENGLEPCSKEEDNLVMGITKDGKSEPVVFGAEYILVTGEVKRGDFICTSNIPGHGMAVKKKRWGIFKRDLTGIVIGQALEDANGESNLIKCMINKC
jgi:hypothetical protein